jgi:hypothetical protein
MLMGNAARKDDAVFRATTLTRLIAAARYACAVHKTAVFGVTSLDGSHVMVDAVDRVFSDDKPGAMEMVRELKKRNRGSLIQTRDRSNENLTEMLEDAAPGERQSSRRDLRQPQ